MAALELQKQERAWLKANKMFIPPWKHGSTWVNVEAWTDGYHEGFEACLDYEKNKSVRQRQDQEKYCQKIRNEYQEYLQSKSVPALKDILKDGGQLAGVCGWLIKEIIKEKGE